MGEQPDDPGTGVPAHPAGSSTPSPRRPGGRRTWWWAALAALLAVAVVLAWLVHRPNRVSAPTAMPSADLDAQARCLAARSTDGSPGPATAIELGSVTLAWASDRSGGLCIGGVPQGRDTFLAPEASGAVTAAVRAGDQYILAAGGQVDSGEESVQVSPLSGRPFAPSQNAERSKVQDGHWLWTVTVPASGVDQLGRVWLADSAGGSRSFDIVWPKVPNPQLPASPSSNDPCPAEKSTGDSKLTWTLVHGPVQWCAYDNSGAPDVRVANTNVPNVRIDYLAYRVVAADDLTDALAVYGGGVAPQGADSVRINTPWGTSEATVGHGHWLWGTLLPEAALGVAPDYLTVTAFAAGRLVKSARLHVMDTEQVTLARSVPAALHGLDLATNCLAGKTYAMSDGGHVLVSRRNGVLSLCTRANDAAWPATAPLRRPTGGDADFTPTILNPTPGGATLAIAGGAVPQGVTSIVFQTPGGPVPATLTSGMWVFEQLIGRYSSGTTPTAVVLTGPHVNRTIMLR